MSNDIRADSATPTAASSAGAETKANAGRGDRLSRHLIICVNYYSDDQTHDYVNGLQAANGDGRVHVAIADNSEPTSTRLAALAAGLPHTSYFHFPHNPGYAGAARLVLASMIAERTKLLYDSVTLCNVDIEFELADFLNALDTAIDHDPDCRWVLGPDIVETGRSYRANPHVAHAPSSPRNSLGHLLRRTYPTFAAYRKLYYRKRAGATNPHAAEWPAWKPIYSCHGSFMIFGRGYFTAGGSFPEGPLFEEEHAVAEIARAIDCPMYYLPDLRIHHEGELTTAAPSRKRYELYRRASDFYANWDPTFCIGTMSTWFAAQEPALTNTAPTATTPAATALTEPDADAALVEAADG